MLFMKPSPYGAREESKALLKKELLHKFQMMNSTMLWKKRKESTAEVAVEEVIEEVIEVIKVIVETEMSIGLMTIKIVNMVQSVGAKEDPEEAEASTEAIKIMTTASPSPALQGKEAIKAGKLRFNRNSRK